MNSEFAATIEGRQICMENLPRHRHAKGYVCLVLKGRYEEAGDRGRFEIRAGDVVFHRPFEAHLNRFQSQSVDLVNFEFEGWHEHDFERGRATDPDLIARLGAEDKDEAMRQLLAMAHPVDERKNDWPDQLAADISRQPTLSLTKWARTHGLAAATVSRGFRQLYGVAPNLFRAQSRARGAWRRILRTCDPLSVIACEGGFADQAHMTRSVKTTTGRTPAQWRAAPLNAA